MSWLSANGVMPSNAQLSDLGTQALGSLGRVTAAVGSVLGALTSLVLVIVIGVFIAIEPRLYERGLACMLPATSRGAFSSVEPTSELQSLLRISSPVLCLKKKNHTT